MQRSDWTELITHRTCTVTLQDVLLTMVKARLQTRSNSKHSPRLVRDHVRLSVSIRGSI
jgi:hypothetical protein